MSVQQKQNQADAYVPEVQVSGGSQFNKVNQYSIHSFQTSVAKSPPIKHVLFSHCNLLTRKQKQKQEFLYFAMADCDAPEVSQPHLSCSWFLRAPDYSSHLWFNRYFECLNWTRGWSSKGQDIVKYVEDLKWAKYRQTR